MALVGKPIPRTKYRSKGHRTTPRKSFFVVSGFFSIVALVLLFFQQAKGLNDSLQTFTADKAQPVFSLLVTAQFRSVEDKQEFLENFKSVAKYVRSSEPTTLAYEALLSDKDPLQVMILERYVDKENAYLTVHKSSKAFLAFRKQLQSMQDNDRVILSGNSYLDSGVGFGDRILS